MIRRFARSLAMVAFMTVAAFLALAASTAAATAVAQRFSYPPTKVDVVRDTLHGTVIEDPYRWLEDKQSPATRAWLDREAAFTDSVLGALPGRDAIRTRLGELLKVDIRSLPTLRGDRYFFSGRAADQDLPVLYVRRSARGKDEVLVDPHRLSPDYRISVSNFAVDHDGKTVAIATRTGGEDEIVLSFMDVDTRRELPDHLPKARYFNTLGFTSGHRGVFYSRFETDGPRVYYHAFGTDAAQDVKRFGDGYGRDKIINLTVSENGRWLLIITSRGSAGGKNEIFVQDIEANGPIVPVVTDLDATSSPDIAGNTLFLRTNWQAPNYRLLAIDLEHPERANWKEIIPAGPHVLQNVTPAGGKLFVGYLENVVAKIRIFDLQGRAIGEVPLPGLGPLPDLNGEWNSNELLFSFSSFNTPTTIYRYDIAKGTRDEWWHSRSPFDGSPYEVKQVWYSSKNGTKVPMFLAHRKGLKLDGTHPVHLTGYGGFNQASTPNYSTNVALWLERGGVWVLANLRGGSEFGEAWHQAGMLGNKQNVFDDFIAAAEWLIAKKYTTRERLAIGGGSNGGLLVGAAFTQRPDLFRAVFCSIPLLDMVRYHQFLVARFWIPEYGSAEDPEQFRFIHAYSPYHHVRPGERYPAVMFMSGDSDTRVDPLHARKMAALMQAANGSEHPILLHYDVKAGHSSSGKPVVRQIDDDTDRNLFLMWQLGMLDGAKPAADAHGTARNP